MSRGGGSSTNDAIIKQQKEEAAQADRDKFNRDQRMAYGRDKIKAAFRGGTVGPYKQLTDPSRTLVGYQDNPTTYRERDGSYTVNERVPIYGTTSPSEVFKGKKTTYSGIGDDFYDAYGGTVADFYKPQVEEQYTDAKSQNLFNLARRGTLRSSVAADNAAEIAKEKANAELDVANRARTQQDQLKSDVNRAESSAYDVLQSSEDPSLAISQALREATAIQSRAPDLSGSLGNLFSAPLEAYANYQDVSRARNYRDTATTPRTPTQSSGRAFG